MSRVITFSRTFPAYHPKAGQPTYFVEKFYNSLYQEDGDWSRALGDTSNYVVLDLDFTIRDFKHHTIRAGHRFKAGDYFSPRVWGDDINPKSGKKGAYQSKQIVIAPDIEVKKVWDIEIEDMEYCLKVRDKWTCGSMQVTNQRFSRIAENDGLSIQDCCDWFYYQKPRKKIEGQIICWNESIQY